MMSLLMMYLPRACVRTAAAAEAAGQVSSKPIPLLMMYLPRASVAAATAEAAVVEESSSSSQLQLWIARALGHPIGPDRHLTCSMHRPMGKMQTRE
jgi:hypothetical protein